jgi:hypothetical protein
MDPYTPKRELLKHMHAYRTKPSKTGGDPQYVQAGQWNRLGDMPDVGLEGDGGEGRAVKVTEDGEILFRVFPGDWIVETGPEVFEKFTNEEFNDHFMSVVKDTLAFKMKTPGEPSHADQKINRPTRHEKAESEKHSLKEEKGPGARLRDSGRPTAKESEAS